MNDELAANHLCKLLQSKSGAGIAYHRAFNLAAHLLKFRWIDSEIPADAIWWHQIDPTTQQVLENRIGRLVGVIHKYLENPGKYDEY
jgi:hypothetical protein